MFGKLHKKKEVQLLVGKSDTAYVGIDEDDANIPRCIPSMDAASRDN